MNVEELRRVLDRAFELYQKYSRLFTQWECLGLTCFSDEMVLGIGFAWQNARGEDSDFDAWLPYHNAALAEKYKQQRLYLWHALRQHTAISDTPSIQGIYTARQQLGN